MGWLSFALLAVPIRAQLSALAFTKSMKMEDIKSAQDSQRKDSTCRAADDADGAVGQTGEETTSRNPPSPTEDVTKDDADEAESEAVLEAKQGAINLVAVDAQRIAEFCAFNSELLGTFLKVTIAVAFLVRLIGWYAVLAGLAVPVIFQPLNSVAAKRYAAQQSKFMVARDSKSYLVTEALQGIRQIKFSAIEAQWQAVILAARTRELDAQWRAYLWAIYLTFCWVRFLWCIFSLHVKAFQSILTGETVCYANLSRCCRSSSSRLAQWRYDGGGRVHIAGGLYQAGVFIVRDSTCHLRIAGRKG